MTITEDNIDISTIIGAAETPHLACCQYPTVKEFMCGAPFHEELLERGEGPKCPECLAIVQQFSCPAAYDFPGHLHCPFAPSSSTQGRLGICRQGPIGT